MEELALRVRAFVYTMICFQCLIQLSAGNSFYKYLKLISQLFALCICCNIIFSFLGIVEDGWKQADKVYEEWEKQWKVEGELGNMEGHLGDWITEDVMIAFEQRMQILLEEESGGTYELEEAVWNKKRWEVTIRRTGIQEKEDFIRRFKESACREFSLGEEELEVRIR
ncbi:MAG: hypothetical protein IJO85_12365 [Lachnospiraceae bacterium]|nr:hypothetical protein [Lachnospiraceae bacterium]